MDSHHHEEELKGYNVLRTLVQSKGGVEENMELRCLEKFCVKTKIESAQKQTNITEYFNNQLIALQDHEY